MRLHLSRQSACCIIAGRWFAVRFPWMPLLFSERYGGKPGLRLFGFRFHTKPFRRYDE